LERQNNELRLAVKRLISNEKEDVNSAIEHVLRQDGYCQAGETGDEESNGVGDDHPARSFNQVLNRASNNEPTGPEHVVGDPA
jgi:hypothetical protein